MADFLAHRQTIFIYMELFMPLSSLISHSSPSRPLVLAIGISIGATAGLLLTNFLIASDNSCIRQSTFISQTTSARPNNLDASGINRQHRIRPSL